MLADRELLLSLLDEAFEKKSWHGPNLRGALRGVTAEQAAWRPAPGRHNIHELTLHAAYWKYAVRRKLTGEKRGSFARGGSNWLSPGDWRKDVALLAGEHQQLRRAVAALTAAERQRHLRLIRGVAAHDLYHAGQVQLLKRLRACPQPIHVVGCETTMVPDAVAFSEGRVRGFLHRPAGEARNGLVIAHGAGGNAGMPLLVAVAKAFAEAGVLVLRCDLPFRQKRPYGPPSPAAAAEDRAGLREAAAVMRRMAPGRVFLGGQSYGGRQASLLAAEDSAVAEALLLLSYPLHPPGKPEQARTSHFPALRIPAMFVHGTRDPFASTEELRAAMALIPAAARIVEIDGAGHDLERGAFDAAALVVRPFLTAFPQEISS